jgi:hypothetical protein
MEWRSWNVSGIEEMMMGVCGIRGRGRGCDGVWKRREEWEWEWERERERGE